ncbi:MAG: Gldg family protein [Casimicrobiaceae bacterium]
MTEVLRIARKEFRGFFASPAAWLFMGAFLAVTLFVFFWVETFFARNIADVRPMFQWMPILLIFLVAALTMRSWSEERRAGTLESLLTAPVRPLNLVLGKFVAALALVAVALALTLPLPVTVSFLGPLDWGPVVGGYVATLFLAAAYVAIGVYMSSRTDNPIVALILTTLVCGAFYLIGSDTLVDLFGYRVGHVLALLGTGTRFESITRGVLDLRDLYYYVSIVGIFLALNLFTLERLRWAGNPGVARHRLWGWMLGLAAVNFAAANLWLAPIGWVRADITHGHIYTLSAATRQQLARLKEPLLIRGYFSARTHPLLAPLVPQVEDLLREYAVAAGGKARVEFIDPTRDRAAEDEAAAKYGIKPVPFRTANRYQSAVVNAYFDVVVAYGDQFQHLGFQDLIEAKASGERSIDVVLKNPEYAITQAIRKVVDEYRAGGNPFESLTEPVTFHGYLSPDAKLPASLRKLHADLQSLLDQMQKQAGGKLKVAFEDPDGGGGKLATQLKQRYGFGPQIASLLDTHPFWFYMVLTRDGSSMQVPLPDTLDKAALKRSLEAAIERMAPGYLKTVALFAPPGYGPGSLRYTRLQDALAANERIVNTDLKSGRVPADADLLLVLAPQSLDDKQRFAMDQFLMQGGSIVIATSPFDVQFGDSLTATKVDSGLKDWLAQMGVGIGDTMVLDTRDAALPIPVQRDLGGIPVREIRMLPYPQFPDLRGAGLDPQNPITENLGQLTVNWASPISIDATKNKSRSVAELLKSSPQSWTSAGLDVIPDYRAHPDTGFAVTGERKPRLLAVALQGRFDSFYAGKPSPLATAAAPRSVPDANGGKSADTGTTQGANAATAANAAADAAPAGGVIDRSPGSAKLVVIASNTFASDGTIDLASAGLGTLYTKPLEFMQNAIDWSLQDPGLLALRGRTQLARTLAPMPEREQRMWEYANYALALAGLLIVWFWRRQVGKADRRRYQRILAEVQA